MAAPAPTFEPLVHYEVWRVDLWTNTAGRRCGGLWPLGEKGAAKIAAEYNAEEAGNALYEFRDLRTHFIVVKATTHFEAVG